MPKVNATPRISVNKLGEYLVSKAGRQQRILYDAKFPSDLITPYYRDAEEAISQFITSGLQDIGILERKMATLDQSKAETVYQTRRVAGNIEAMEQFTTLLDDMNLFGAVPQLGARKAA